ncbi:hypothetical protein Cflav_PD3920 [Pedosphaera parvula Ellin514]|uniref:Uncharacterized protein n=1 Tax=Pedosphaera parvula (strain Ellin514) TaxID=320771 RepID=B9XG41_PEDPL|nr:hypothetical protein Cflav_PD3920 [Pedosphaera parvula Ellin514]
MQRHEFAECIRTPIEWMVMGIAIPAVGVIVAGVRYSPTSRARGNAHRLADQARDVAVGRVWM